MRVAVIHDNSLRRRLVAEALGKGEIYCFKTPYGEYKWLKREYAYLAVNGCVSLLRRLGIDCAVVDEETNTSVFDMVIDPHQVEISQKGQWRKICWPGFFEDVGGMLQGHINVWQNDFDLEKMAMWLARALDYEPDKDGLNIIIMRHDTDSSTDTTYLNYEIRNNIPATYAVLKQNCKAWLEMLRCTPDLFEVSWHYPSIGTIPYLKWNNNKPVGEVISHQVDEGDKNGVKSVTVHKHGNVFYYPETIAALEYAYDKHPELIGMGTMLRWNLKKWGREEYLIRHPKVSVSLWHPFHLAISTVEKYRELPGWDIGGFIEPDMQTIDRIFEHGKDFPGGVYPLCFHPAHAQTDTFIKGGCIQWFKYAVDRAWEAGWLILNYRQVYQNLSERERCLVP
jgi:hypothetical protein